MERSKFGSDHEYFTQNERDQALVDEYESGTALYEIASQFDLAIGTIEKVLNERLDNYERSVS